jgi:hypothetical protein
LTTRQIWSPAINNWFPGITPPVMETLTAQQILDCIRFMKTNSQDA